MQSDRCPHAGRAFDSNMPSGLSNKAIDHAEAESGALADLFGRKKGLKNLIPHFGRHSASSVYDGQPDVRSGQVPSHGSFIQDDVPRLDLEYAAIRHGVARIQDEVEESGLQQRRVDIALP